MPVKQLMRVRELMNRNLVTINKASTGREAIGRMHRSRVRHLPVLDDKGVLVGVVTDRDLRHHLFSPAVYRTVGETRVEDLLEQVTVDKVMSAPARTVDSSDDIARAAEVMRRHRVGSLPVLEGGRLIGIITETDVLREVCRADAECSAEVTDVVVSYP